jgi:transcriptional regulator
VYIPAHFHEKDLARLDWLAAHDAFGTLVSQVDGAPFATHLPVIYRREGNRVTLWGHWARPNPQWQGIAGQRVLFIFHGPHAYISPRWYVEPKRQVPTWNYATAHLYGQVALEHDPAVLAEHVAALADKYERGAPEPWRLADSHPGNVRALTGVVGFELTVDEIQVKYKLNQNHPAGNREGVVQALSQSSSQDGQTIAVLMAQALGRPPRG